MPHDCDGSHCHHSSHYQCYSSRSPSPPTPKHAPEFCDGIHCTDISHQWYRADRKAAAAAARRQEAVAAQAKREQAIAAEIQRREAAVAEAERQQAAAAEARRREEVAAEAKRQAEAAQAQPDRKSTAGRKTSISHSRRSSASSTLSDAKSSRRNSNASMRSASTTASSVASNYSWQLNTLERTPSNKFQVELERSAVLEWAGTVDQQGVCELLADSPPAAASTAGKDRWKLTSSTRTPSDEFDVRMEKTYTIHKKAKLNPQKLKRVLASSGRVTKSAEKALKKR